MNTNKSKRIWNFIIIFAILISVLSPWSSISFRVVLAEETSHLEELADPGLIYEKADITLQQAHSITDNLFSVNIEEGYEAFTLELQDPELSFDDILISVELTNGQTFNALKVHPSDERYGDEDYAVLTSQLFTFNEKVLTVTVLNANDDQVQVKGVSNTLEQPLGASAVDPVDSQFRDQSTKDTFFGNMDIDIVTREEWGAPSTSIWKPTIVSDVSTIVVHHTATTVDNEDPANTVRSIYNYHSNLCSPYTPDCSARWNDIGYNYLIDQYGNIYEGRVGGNGVIAAHSPPNYGTIGIAILGNYSGYTPEAPSQRSLELLIARLSELNDINIEWENTVLGHRHRQNTACPGGMLYDLMPGIVSAAKVLKGSNSKLKDINSDVATMISTESVTTDDDKVEVILEKESLSSDMLDQIERYTKNVSDFREYGSKILFNVDSGSLAKVLRENKILLNDSVNLQPNYIYEHASWDNDDPDRSLPGDFDVDGDEHWYLDRTNVPEAWKDLGGCVSDDLCGGDPEVIVAVVDTGIAYETYIDSDLDEGYDAGGDFEVQTIHGRNLEVPTTGKNGVFNEGYDRIFSQAPELSDVEFVSPKDIVQEYFCELRESTDYQCNTYELEKINHANDDDGHGTFVATIIAGNTDDGVDGSDNLIGIAHNVKIMPVDVFLPNDSSMGTSRVLSTTLFLENGINHAVENGADVINMSISGGGYDQFLQDALDNAIANNAVVVAAAGNTSSEIADYIFPGIYDNIIVVGASTKSDTRASYSTYGSSIDLVAPVDSGIGSQWYSCSLSDSCYREDLGDLFESGDFTDEDSPVRVAGTSFAAPQVAAAAALLRQKDSSLNASSITQILTETADDIVDSGKDIYTGSGVLNILDALQYVDNIDPEDRFFNPFNWKPSFGRSSWNKFLVGDFNGDGLTDIAVAVENGSEDKLKWIVSLSKENSFGDVVVWKSSFGRSSWHEFLAGDFNGDGIDDIAGAAPNGDEDKLNWVVMESTGTDFDTVSKWRNAFGRSSWDEFLVGDFNNDDSYDIVGASPNGDEDKLNWVVMGSSGTNFNSVLKWREAFGRSSWHELLAGDFNGDNSTDIVGAAPNGDEDKLNWVVMESSGSDFDTVSKWRNAFGRSSWQEFLVGDFNGDNRTDIVGAAPNGDEDKLNWVVMESSGSDFDIVSKWRNSFGRSSWNRFYIGQLNSNSKSDIYANLNSGDEDKLKWLAIINK